MFEFVQNGVKVDFDNKICVLLKPRRSESVQWLGVRRECVARAQCVIRIRIFEVELFLHLYISNADYL